jgi:hypothetical protein
MESRTSSRESWLGDGLITRGVPKKLRIVGRHLIYSLAVSLTKEQTWRLNRFDTADAPDSAVDQGRLGSDAVRDPRAFWRCR